MVIAHPEDPRITPKFPLLAPHIRIPPPKKVSLLGRENVLSKVFVAGE